jgi:hypothetical protein
MQLSQYQEPNLILSAFSFYVGFWHFSNTATAYTDKYKYSSQWDLTYTLLPEPDVAIGFFFPFLI